MRIKQFEELRSRIGAPDYEAYKQEILSGDGLVLALFFDEGRGDRVIDASGHGNHGTIYGARWTKRNGVWSLSFDGADDYVDYGVSGLNGFPSGNDPRTITVWAKLADTPLRAYRMASFGNSTQYEGCFIGFYQDYMFAWGFWSYDLNYTTDLTQYVGKWAFWAGTYDGLVARSYINGVEVASGNYPNVNTVLVRGFIGDQLNQAEKFPGLISEVRIYNRALSADEIARHWQLGLPFHPA